MKAVENDITQEELREFFSCDPETGVLIWRKNRGSNMMAGRVAGNLRTDGYIRVKVRNRNLYAQRVVWAYFTSQWPTNEIDHRDNNRSNNRFDNLREGTKSQNLQNQQRPQRHNKSGFLGVSWHKGVGKWHAQIGIDNKMRHIAYFDTPQEAHEAYLESKRRSHDFCMI